MSEKNSVKMVEIDVDHAGQRIDNYLVSALKGVPKSHLYRILRKGEVRVNKKRVKPDYRLQVNDLVRLPPVRVAEQQLHPGMPSTNLIAFLEKRIIFEDERLIVINKPAGIAVHGGSGINWGIIEALRAARPHAKFLELIHRLDRDTSGCLLLAKKRVMLCAVQELLREGQLLKIYYALLKGKWEGGTRKVDVSLQKNQLLSGERMVKVALDGKPSSTVFIPEGLYEEATLLKVKLETGRTHQIRVHAAHIDHPVAGDDKYGDADFNKRMRRLGLKRLFLHAASLRFKLPDDDQIFEFKAELDDELHEVIKRLERGVT